MEILGEPPDGPADRGRDRDRPVFEVSLDEPGAGAPARQGPAPAPRPRSADAEPPRGAERVNGVDRGLRAVPGEPGEPGEPGGPLEPPEPTTPSWSLTRLAASVLTSEALGLTGLVLVLGALVGFPQPYLWADSGAGPVYDPRAQVDFAGRATAVLALLALGAGTAAVLRLGNRPTTAARTLAGAAVVLGALLLLYAGALLWRYSGLPDVQPPVDALTATGWPAPAGPAA